MCLYVCVQACKRARSVPQSIAIEDQLVCVLSFSVIPFGSRPQMNNWTIILPQFVLFCLLFSLFSFFSTFFTFTFLFSFFTTAPSPCQKKPLLHLAAHLSVLPQDPSPSICCPLPPSPSTSTATRDPSSQHNASLSAETVYHPPPLTWRAPLRRRTSMHLSPGTITRSFSATKISVGPSLFSQTASQ